MTSACVDTFAATSGEERQRAVYVVHNGFGCEEHKCSEHSPGPVNENEVLIFLLINPTHFDQITGILNPIAFQEVHNRDLSVFRRQFATSDEVYSTINDLIERGMQSVPPKLRKIDQFCEAGASEIRAQQIDMCRSFAVYDTALEQVRSHASVFTRPDVLDSSAKRAVARKKLHAVFGKNIRDIRDLPLTNS